MNQYVQSDYPLDEETRTAIRTQRLEEHTIKAMSQGVRYGRSLRCRENDHGCLNNGTTCLCICHDRKG